MGMKTQMAINLTTLTREWIQYLKNNQIASTQSDPKTGKLKYQRKPNVQELIRFLELKTDFDDADVRNAIKTVLSSKGTSTADKPTTPALNAPEKPGTPSLAGPQSKDVSTWTHDEMTPGDRPERRNPLDAPAKGKKYSNDDAEDATYRDVKPGEPPRLTRKKPRYKHRGDGQEPTRLSEDFYDRQGVELDENDIKQIFRILLSPKAEPEEPAPEGPSPEEVTAKQQEDLRKIKRLIRDTMTPQQRKALWRALNEVSESLTEDQVNPADAKEVFKVASALRGTPTGLGKIFKGLRKDKIDVNDLQQAWKEAGFPDDTQDLMFILKDHGFSAEEVNKVFARVFGGDKKETEFDQPVASPTIQKIVDYAKKANIVEPLKVFMLREFPGEFEQQPQKRGWFREKAVVEEIRQIFTEIVKEERTERYNLIRQQEQKQLGRTKK